ncbi:hypothetical protein IB268_26465 [Achromobacter sp. ACM01]|uniref:hypothetical protein n=1 Tax=Achromobacter sp. ACM01 TaxID=2769298 RepID=UPI001784443A|nr:hypothetical protein [Achromobacter sp. ACM01]MBD9476482.1 hypothetical protein [Achromobacter sp. ACM01]
MNLTPTESYDPMAGTLAARTRMQCAARGCDGCMVCVPDQYARAVEAPTSGLGKINTDAADPWARGGAETPPDASPRRTNAGSMVVSTVGLNVNILALDLGTKTGFALRRRDGTCRHGTEVFTPRKSWSEGQKWARYRAWLAGVIRDEQIHRVVYEQVIRHEVKGRPVWDAAHAYGAFEAITHMVCDGFNIRAHGVNLSTVKKSFTGSGRAKKEDMVLQAKTRGFKVVDDNNADALAILHWAVAQELP